MIRDFHFVHLNNAADILLVLVAVTALVFASSTWGLARRRRALGVFGMDLARGSEWIAACSRRRWLRTALLALAFLFLTVALLGPRCNPEKAPFRRQARDIAVIVDVSRSMLAADLKPSRLERAKLELQRLSDRLAGDRVGLVAFAGDAVIKCPLTSNYSYFKSVVRNISTASASQGGTRIGDAIRKALDDLLGIEAGQSAESQTGVRPGETVLEEEARSHSKSYSDIFLITDGEDHDSYPQRAAERAAGAGVGLYVVGLGSEQGTPIPVLTEAGATELLTYKGEIVKSRLDSRTLMDMVNTAPRGAYLPAGTDNFDLVDFYRNTLGQEEGREITEERVSWTEVYQPFLLGGFFVYILYLLVPERPRGRRSVELAEAKA